MWPHTAAGAGGQGGAYGGDSTATAKSASTKGPEISHHTVLSGNAPLGRCQSTLSRLSNVLSIIAMVMHGRWSAGELRGS